MRGFLAALFRLVLRVFFRQIQIQGQERVPEQGPVVFVLNHPNALMDPAFMLCFAPRPVSFLAKSTLFKMPVIGAIVRGFDCLPVYRRGDKGVDPAKNRETFDQARDLLARGGSIALFPEGTSHSDPRLRPLKTGAARIALGAASALSAQQGPLLVVPSGLHYTRKTTFRSRALVVYGEPFEVQPVALDQDHEPPRQAAQALTEQIGAALAEVTLQAEAVEVLRLVELAEQLVTGAQPDGSLAQRFALRRRMVEGYQRLRRDHGPRLEALELQVTRLSQECAALGVRPHHLSGQPLALGELLRASLVHLLVFSLLGPLGLLGWLLHQAPYHTVDWLAHRYARGEDDMLSTLKVLGALLLFPLTWGVVAGAALWWRGWPWGALALALGPASGLAALHLTERLESALGAARAIRAFFSQRRELERLMRARQAIEEELLALEALASTAPA